ncbi:unnamed protein product, partial [Prorocentrum cordatum]
MGASASLAGFSSHAAWSMKSVQARIMSGQWNPLADVETGSWMPFKWRWWKAFVVLERLRSEEVQEGEWVVYQDSTSYVRSGFNETHAAKLSALLGALEAAGSDGLAGSVLPPSVLWEWTQRCTPSYSVTSFDEWRTMGEGQLLAELSAALERAGLCGEGDGACRSDFQGQAMLQNSWVAFRKGAAALKFVDRWLRSNCDEATMRAMPFADQSLLQLLAHRATASGELALHALRFPAMSATPPAPEAMADRGSLANRVKHLGVALD